MVKWVKIRQPKRVAVQYTRIPHVRDLGFSTVIKYSDGKIECSCPGRDKCCHIRKAFA